MSLNDKKSSHEVWKDILGYEGIYQVSNFGKVKSLKRATKNQHGKQEIILKQRTHRDGYLRVNLKKEGKMKVQTVHRLVASAFLDNENNLVAVNHIDGDKTNNKLSNLEWCSIGENTKHAYKKGLADAARGQNSSRSKLRERDVERIYFLYFEKQIRPVEIAKKFEVSRRCIEKIVNFETWTDFAKKCGVLNV